MRHPHQPYYEQLLDRETPNELEEFDGKPFPAGPQHLRPPINGFTTTGERDVDVNDIVLLHLIDRQGQHECPAHADIFKRSGKGIILQGKDDVLVIPFAFVPPSELTGIHLGVFPFLFGNVNPH